MEGACSPHCTALGVLWLLKQRRTHRSQHINPKGSMCVLEVYGVEVLTSGAVCLCAGYGC